MLPDGLVPMESAGSTRGCGQPMDSPNGIFCDHDFPPTIHHTSLGVERLPYNDDVSAGIRNLFHGRRSSIHEARQRGWI